MDPHELEKSREILAPPKSFLAANFTYKDLVLYLFCFLLAGFLAFYFTGVNASSEIDFMSAHDKTMMNRLALEK